MRKSHEKFNRDAGKILQRYFYAELKRAFRIASDFKSTRISVCLSVTVRYFYGGKKMPKWQYIVLFLLFEKKRNSICNSY